MKSICKYSLAMSPNVSKTVAFQTRELYTTSQKNPRQKYHFIFEIEAEIVGEVPPKIRVYNGISYFHRPPPQAVSQTTILIITVYFFNERI